MSEDETQVIIEWLLASKVPDLRGVPLDLIPALGEDEGPEFSSAI